MAASYDGDGNRVFQISRSKAVTTVLKSDTSDAEKNPEASNSGIADPETPGSFENNPSGIEDVPSSNQTEVHTYYEKIYANPEDSIFWYGFGQGLMNFFGNINSALSAYLSNWFCTAWDYVTGQYELALHSEAEYSDADIEVMKATGLSESEISEIVNLCVANGEQKVVSYEDVAVSTASASTDATEIIIPVVDNGSVNDYAEYELTYYVNDINTANTQVLMTYGGNASEKSVYTYGVGRVSEEKVQEEETGEYIYDGRGSVVQTAVAGEIELSITYDPFGEITGGVDDNFIGYAYNGEESNQVTGLQYLRARYYDSELGSFITIDSYLGSLTDVLSQNRYTYAENNPVNNIDPSGHSSQNVNGIANYRHDTWLNEMRNYMTSAAMYAGQIEAQNTVISDALDHAMSLDFKLFEGISIISQADMNRCINDAVRKAGKVSLNYGCSVPAVPNVAIAKLENTLETARQNANEQISVIKESKRIKYNAYQNSLHNMELLKKEAEEFVRKFKELIFGSGNKKDSNTNSANHNFATKFDFNKKNELLKSLEAQVKKDLSFIEENKNVGYYSTKDALDKVLAHDNLITDISNKYGLPKEMIQTVLFRELRFYDIRDTVADGLVEETYAYYVALENYFDLPWFVKLFASSPQPPLKFSDDSSTGIGQIFAKTAINATNYAVEEGLINGAQLDFNNKEQRFEIWKKLQTNEDYNIEMVALVLIYGADDVGLSNEYYSYSDDEIKAVLARYNGTNDDAKEYGRESFGWYEIFKLYNGG